MIGGFQVGPFQTSFQQGTVVPPPPAGGSVAGGSGKRKRHYPLIPYQPVPEDVFAEVALNAMEVEEVRGLIVKAKAKKDQAEEEALVMILATVL